MQEEAYSLRIPRATLREDTERPEAVAVEEGNLLVGTDPDDRNRRAGDTGEGALLVEPLRRRGGGSRRSSVGDQ